MGHAALSRPRPFQGRLVAQAACPFKAARGLVQCLAVFPRQ